MTRHVVATGAAALGLAAIALAVPARPVDAWGASGHHLISRAAAEAFPSSLPAFVRTTEAIHTIEALGSEADRLKGAGKELDADEDPGHYLDLGDDDRIDGVIGLESLPRTRLAYDTALRAAGSNQYAMGFLPFTLIDGWQQVAMDFAIWRTDRVGTATAPTVGDRFAFAADMSRREVITIHDIGYWSHFVGDASQPLHVTTHFNGWGDGANPEGFTTSHGTHAHFEGAYVRENATLPLVEAAMTPPVSCGCTIGQFVATYLKATNAQVVPLYRLDKQGAFASSTPSGVSFVVARLADGASALRDLVSQAYDASGQLVVGYPDGHTVGDYEAGRAVPRIAAIAGSD